MMNFKDWFYAEDMNPTMGGPMPQMKGPNPVADTKVLTQAVQGTMQDNRLPKIASSMPNNKQNPGQLQQQIVPIAQDFLKKNPNIAKQSPVTALDIAKQMTPQLSNLGQNQQPFPNQ